MKVTLNRPWLVADLGGPRRVLSWSLNRPGFVTASRIVWREVRNADLPEGLDAVDWFEAELRRVGVSNAVGLLTSRDVSFYIESEAEVENAAAHTVATVGLSNAERVSEKRRTDFTIGTINVAVSVSLELSEAAMIETLSLASEARTAAIMDHGPNTPSGRATGTGTDCIAVAAPTGETRHAGLHTPIGEAVGRAVYEAVARGAKDWMKEHGGRHA